MVNSRNFLKSLRKFKIIYLRWPRKMSILLKIQTGFLLVLNLKFETPDFRMKILTKVVVVIALNMALVSYTIAQETRPKYTAKQVYEYFAGYSPQDVVSRAKEAVKFYQKIAEKAEGLPKEQEEKLFKDALIEFHHKTTERPISEFPLTFIYVPQRCDQGRVVAHYIPDFFKFARIEGFIKKYKDIKGKKVGVILCQDVRENPNGVWSKQYQWWPETDKPLEMGFFMIAIPNTPYELQGFYPSQKYSEEQLNSNYRK